MSWTASPSEVGVGSNPTATLVLIALLTVFRFGEQQLKGAIMNKKSRNSKSKARGAKRFMSGLASITVHFFETVWATGASVAAAMVISTPIYCAGHRRVPRALIC